MDADVDGPSLAFVNSTNGRTEASRNLRRHPKNVDTHTPFWAQNAEILNPLFGCRDTSSRQRCRDKYCLLMKSSVDDSIR